MSWAVAQKTDVSFQRSDVHTRRLCIGIKITRHNKDLQVVIKTSTEIYKLAWRGRRWVPWRFRNAKLPRDRKKRCLVTFSAGTKEFFFFKFWGQRINCAKQYTNVFRKYLLRLFVWRRFRTVRIRRIQARFGLISWRNSCSFHVSFKYWERKIHTLVLRHFHHAERIQSCPIRRRTQITEILKPITKLQNEI